MPITAKQRITAAPGTLPWLVEIMNVLLSPEGCPWDREQTLNSLRPFLLEECYEVLDAIDEGDKAHHCEELGDLLYQIVFQSALAGFPLESVVRSIGEKLIRRHPHVFGDGEAKTTADVLSQWQKHKEKERGGTAVSALHGVPQSMPALLRAQHLTHKAAQVGFSFVDAAGAREKFAEELSELDQAITSGKPSETAHELGDTLFALSNWARQLGIDPEDALRQANQRFERRFVQMETQATSEGQALKGMTLSELLQRWSATKSPNNR